MKHFLFFFLLLMTIISVQAQDQPPSDVAWIVDLITRMPWLGYLMASISSLVVLGKVVIVITPSKKDDEWLAKAEKAWYWKIVDAITYFAPIKKK